MSVSVRVIRAPKDGRCLFHCLVYSRLSCEDQARQEGIDRNEANFPVMHKKAGRWCGRLDKKAYDAQVEAAKDAATPYISFLEQSGQAQQAADIKKGRIPPEGLEVLQDIATACKVHLVLWNKNSEALEDVGDLEHPTVFMEHSKMEGAPEHFDLLLPDADHENVLLDQLKEQKSLWKKALLNLVLKCMLLHCVIL